MSAHERLDLASETSVQRCCAFQGMDRSANTCFFTSELAATRSVEAAIATAGTLTSIALTAKIVIALVANNDCPSIRPI